MSDFFLDLRPVGSRQIGRAAESLRHFPDMKVVKVEKPSFSLVLTRCDELEIWGPYESPHHHITVALVGRVTFDPENWESAKEIPGPGGLACKAILSLFIKSGPAALESLNGNFTAIIYDQTYDVLTIITDRCGAAPIFRYRLGDIIISSQPDLIAFTTGTSNDLDTTSLAEFLSTGKVSPPHTYYAHVEALSPGSIFSIRLAEGEVARLQAHRYFRFDYRPDETLTEHEHAERLAHAFTRSVRLRTQPIFGTTAIALSGGLDSRTILACCSTDAKVKSFCFFDEENLEFNRAREIAEALHVEFIPMRRDFEHYGASAEAAVRIYGGMGCFVNNHFLGFRDRLASIGATNVLTGFYCDYMFKGLAQNVVKNRFSRAERLSAFSLKSYRPLQWFSTPAGLLAQDRFESYFPEALRAYHRPADRLNVEGLRVFPLAYEPDNAEATVPQRVLPWFLPTADNGIINAYLQIPAHMKPNASMYSKMVASVCGEKLSSIPDNNTGVAVDAPPWKQCVALYWKALRDRAAKKVEPKIATSGSWPDWEYYVKHSPRIKGLWLRPNESAADVFTALLGFNPFRKEMDYWDDDQLELFLRLLTLKIWFDVRIGNELAK